MGGPTGEVHLVDKDAGSDRKCKRSCLFQNRSYLRQTKHELQLWVISVCSMLWYVIFFSCRDMALMESNQRQPHHTRWLLYLFLVQIPSKFTPVILLLDNLPISPRLLHLVGLLLVMDHDMSKFIQMGRYSIALHCSFWSSLNPANFLDLYEIITIDSAIEFPSLKYIDSRSLLPSHLASDPLKQFRGDTLMLTPPIHAHPSPYALFTTTRGSTSASRGWLSIFALDEDG